jgi:hypothetical protein
MIINVLWFVNFLVHKRADSSPLSYEWLSAQTESTGALVSAVHGPNRASVYGLLCVAMVCVPSYSTVVLALRLIGSRLQLRLADSLRCVLPVYQDCLPWPPLRGTSVTDGACIHFRPRVEKSSRLLSHGFFGRLVRNRDPVMLATAPPE